MTYIVEALRRQVEERAGWGCEYCQLLAALSFYWHEVDHAIALKHGGQTSLDNFAYSCWRCNRHKGTDLGSFDPQTGDFSFLFNPRIQVWAEHFSVEDQCMMGLTSEGQTTVQLLKLNACERMAERQRLEHSN